MNAQPATARSARLRAAWEQIGRDMDEAAAKLPQRERPNVNRYFLIRPEHLRNRMLEGWD